MGGKNGKKSGGLKGIPGGKGQQTPPSETSSVIDFTSVRAKRNLDNRRGLERYFFTHMVDAFCEQGENKPLPIELVEVSETGCSFRMEAAQADVLPRDPQGKHLPIRARLYFSRESYLLVGLQPVHVTPDITTANAQNGGRKLRFGCKLDDTFASTAAYRQFVLFLESFFAVALRDKKQVSSG